MDSNVFLIKWYGPFRHTKEIREEIKKWEEKQNFKCSLYLLHGFRKYAKTKDCYYCGMTTRKVFERFRDKKHHIEEIENRICSIYVGSISNIKTPSRQQIMLAEKIITSYLAGVIGEENMLNSTNFYYPNKDVYVINEWRKLDCDSLWLRQPRNAPSNIVPDVLTYHYENCNDIDLFGCKKLRRLL